MLTILLLFSTAFANPIDDRAGRTQTRIYSAAFDLKAGLDVDDVGLDWRLDQLGYRLVSNEPDAGEYRRVGSDYQIHRRAHHLRGGWTTARVLQVSVEDGRIALVEPRKANWLEPALLSESLTERRAAREPIDISELPPHTWQVLVALEDKRFYKHMGIDARGIARATVQNMRAGHTVEGGSTITQQLVKNRDLKPRRSLDRKAAEAVRAVTMDARYSKDDILEAYLNTVYFGHVDGMAIYGIGTASRAFFSKSATELTLAESATLAAVLQGPNGLNPIRHPDKATLRRDEAIRKLEEVGGLDPETAAAAIATPLTVRASTPRPESAHHLRHYVRALADDSTKRADNGLGVVAWTTVDPHLQHHADAAVAKHANKLGASVAVVSIDASDGRVLAYSASPRDDFDRVRRAARQPGSAAKPFVLLEALDRCGSSPPLTLASQVSDAPFVYDDWAPVNYDRKHHGTVDLHDALVSSHNIPFARVGAHCGFEQVAQRMAWAGLSVPEEAPPSLVLGALESTPLELAGAYAAFANGGRSTRAWAVERLETPAGWRLARERPHRTRTASEQSAWLAHSAMTNVVKHGTGRRASISGLDVAGKTGTSSNTRDAWFAGDANGVVTVVWVGHDDGHPLRTTGGTAAAPIWKDVMEVGARTGRQGLQQPPGIIEKPVTNGLVVPIGKSERVEQFRRGQVPSKRRLWRAKAEVLTAD
jgi:penicillin-binding protein 1B